MDFSIIIAAGLLFVAIYTVRTLLQIVHMFVNLTAILTSNYTQQSYMVLSKDQTGVDQESPQIAGFHSSNN